MSSCAKRCVHANALNSFEQPVTAGRHADARIAQLRQQRAATGQPVELPPLLGVPVAIKDAFATRDMPTSWGTPIRAGQMLPEDAASVRSLRRAGAVILGKTALTEYCSGNAPATRNPRALAAAAESGSAGARSKALGVTPGGSSSGSAAAVAAGYTPVATGTQTLGSTIRPAAFCGVYGFKPALGAVSTDGMMPIATDLDHIGFLARSLSDLRMLLHAHTQQPGITAQDTSGGGGDCKEVEGRTVQLKKAPSFVVPVSAHWDQAEPSAIERLWEVTDVLEHAGARVKELQLPQALDSYPTPAQARYPPTVAAAVLPATMSPSRSM